MVILSPAELKDVTGYVQPAAQIRALREHGFSRARIGPTGGVVLERAHFDAVCRGEFGMTSHEGTRPKVKRVAHV